MINSKKKKKKDQLKSIQVKSHKRYFREKENKEQNDILLGNESTPGRYAHRLDQNCSPYQNKLKGLRKLPKMKGKCKPELGKTKK